MGTPLRTLLDRIRADAGIRGPDTMVGLMIETINAVTREYTGRRRFDQLYMNAVELAPVAPGSGVFNLPADLQVLQKDNAFYSEDGVYENANGLLFSTSFIGSSDGQPNRIQRIGNTLSVWPFSDVVADSRVYINYWRHAVPIANYADTIEIEELEETILHETVARIARHTSTKVVAIAKGEAKDSYGASFGVDAQR